MDWKGLQLNLRHWCEPMEGEGDIVYFAHFRVASASQMLLGWCFVFEFCIPVAGGACQFSVGRALGLAVSLGVRCALSSVGFTPRVSVCTAYWAARLVLYVLPFYL